MADLTKVVGSIMSELIQAQKKALELTKEIGELQKDDPILGMMPVPGLKIDNFDLSLKFIIDDDDGEGDGGSEGSDEPEQPKNPALETAKKRTVIRTLISQASVALFKRSDVTPLIKRLKITPREITTYRSKVNQALIAATDHNTAVFHEKKGNDDVLKFLSTTKFKSPRDIAVMRRAVNAQLADYNSELKTETTPKVVRKRSNLIVDKNRLANVSPELVSTINMSLSLDEYEWVDDEGGSKLRSAG